MKSIAIFSFLLGTLLLQNQASANPTKLKTEASGVDDIFKKNIYKGNQEINISGALGYSNWDGVYTQMDLSYRYFLADKISFGPIFGGYYSDLNRRIDLGVSGRWYFMEVGNWAFSYTQNIVYSGVRQNVPGLFNVKGSMINGLSQLSANYFFTPAVYLGISLDYQYNLSDSGLNYEPGEPLTSRLGFGVSF